MHGTATFPGVTAAKSGDSFVQLGPAWVSVTLTNSFWGAVLIRLLSLHGWLLAMTVRSCRFLHSSGFPQMVELGSFSCLGALPVTPVSFWGQGCFFFFLSWIPSCCNYVQKVRLAWGGVLSSPPSTVLHSSLFKGIGKEMSSASRPCPTLLTHLLCTLRPLPSHQEANLSFCSFLAIKSLSE